MNTAAVRPTDVKDVTVAVRVSNQAAALDACLASVVAQSIGTDRLEVIGSTTGRPTRAGPSWPVRPTSTPRSCARGRSRRG